MNAAGRHLPSSSQTVPLAAQLFLADSASAGRYSKLLLGLILARTESSPCPPDVASLTPCLATLALASLDDSQLLQSCHQLSELGRELRWAWATVREVAGLAEVFGHEG